MYRRVFDSVLSRIDPERIHHISASAVGWVGRMPGAALAGRMLRGTGTIRVMGVDFPGRLGLAAGFDKDATAVRGLVALGFAFVEVGTITAQAQPGNPRPRLWRLKDRDALLNQMGFNNPGAKAAARTLRRLRSTPSGRLAVVGVNIGKTKLTDPALARYDYATSARLLAPYADYLVINVSSPNTPGLRDLQSVEQLRPIVADVRAAADAATIRAGRGTIGGSARAVDRWVNRPRRVPLAVKIAPDLDNGDIDAVCDLALELGLDGIVAVNTTIAHEFGAGGLSGPPLKSRGVEVVRRVRARCGDRLAVIGVGGIASPHDARDYLEAGADLVQAYTALIYHGPAWPGTMNRALR